MTAMLLDAAPVQTYLRQLDRGLRPLPHDDRASIIAEIKSHIADRLAEPNAMMAEILESLGDPDELARSYVEQYKLEDALARSADFSLLFAVMKFAGRSIVAFLTGFSALAAYLFGLAFLWVAASKLVYPRNVGFWWDDTTFSLGAFDKAPGAHELMGYWIIPFSIVSAIVCYLAGRSLMRFGGKVLLRKRSAQKAQ
jgi:hypothetical protein